MTSPLRRVSIPVLEGKMEESIAFYRQVLGMNPYYDQVYQGHELSALLSLPEDAVARLVFLQFPGSMVGQVGLIDYMQPKLKVRSFEKSEGEPYPLYFIFSAENVPEIEQRVKASGAKITKPLKISEMPGKGMARSMVCLDPNGVFIEFLELDVKDTPAKVLFMRRAMYALPNGKMDSTIDFYKSVLGFKPLFDMTTSGTGEVSSLGVGDYEVRIASLQQGQSEPGMVGFFEYFKPKLSIRSLAKTAHTPYPLMFAFLVDDVEAARRMALQAGSVEISSPVRSQARTGEIIEMSCLDPNGVLLNLVQQGPAARP